ncbi:MAG: TauD/TfdA family dioxygenase [Pseudomonadota bacterium]
MIKDKDLASFQHISVTRLSPSVGAEITNVDLSKPLLDAEFQEIRTALGHFGVIFLRHQEISPADQLRFAKAFGEININRFFQPVEGFPEIANVERQPDERGATGWYWHTDHSYDQVPAMGSVFAAREIPPVGGDTLFAGMAAAYEALSDGLKAVLEGLEAWHADTVCPEVAHPTVGAAFADRLPGLDTAGVRAKHPVVIRHPISGRKVLYVNSGFTEGIEGWAPPESKALLDFLYAHATQPQFTYRHRWQRGDVAFWDNRATWHCALDDCFGYRRVLHRITIEGEPLKAACA